MYCASEHWASEHFDWRDRKKEQTVPSVQANFWLWCCDCLIKCCTLNTNFRICYFKQFQLNGKPFWFAGRVAWGVPVWWSHWERYRRNFTRVNETYENFKALLATQHYKIGLACRYVSRNMQKMMTEIQKKRDGFYIAIRMTRRHKWIN